MFIRNNERVGLVDEQVPFDLREEGSNRDFAYHLVSKEFYNVKLITEEVFCFSL